MEKENKKSYDPFKLWGTYLGFLLGIVGSYFSFTIVLHYAETGMINAWILLIPAVPFLLGGLAGYLLHLIARKLLTS
jgi:hypothetical protein